MGSCFLTFPIWVKTGHPSIIHPSFSHLIIHPQTHHWSSCPLLFFPPPLLPALSLSISIQSILSFSIACLLSLPLSSVSFFPKANPWYNYPASARSELFPRHPDGKRQPWQKTLCKRFISFSALYPAPTPQKSHIINRVAAMVRNYPENIHLTYRLKTLDMLCNSDPCLVV